ncbi:Beta-galactosidase GanA [compost metagenome]
MELQIRKNEKSSYAFLLNYSEEAVTITLKEQKTDLLTAETVSGSCRLEGFGVKVLY